MYVTSRDNYRLHNFALFIRLPGGMAGDFECYGDGFVSRHRAKFCFGFLEP
jgi:hypothetical protein